MRYASLFDWLLFFVAFTSAILSGLSYPLQFFAFRGMADFLMESQFRTKNSSSANISLDEQIDMEGLNNR